MAFRCEPHDHQRHHVCHSTSAVTCSPGKSPDPTRVRLPHTIFEPTPVPGTVLFQKDSRKTILMYVSPHWSAPLSAAPPLTRKYFSAGPRHHKSVTKLHPDANEIMTRHHRPHPPLAPLADRVPRRDCPWIIRTSIITPRCHPREKHHASMARLGLT